MVTTIGFATQDYTLWGNGAIGLFFVVVIEIALIAPPAGLDLFVIRAIARAPFGAVATGALPFAILMRASVAILCLMPGTVLFLPGNP